MSEFKVPALPSAMLPQDLAMILELMGPQDDEPEQPKETAEEVIARLEASRVAQSTSESEAVGVQDGATEEASEGVDVASKEQPTAVLQDEGEDSDSDGSDSSSDSDASTSSSVSSASRSVNGNAGPSASIVASHARNARAVDTLMREASPVDSEPEMNPDFFKSANELPQPTTAPALPFERIPEGQGSKVLGTIKSVVGKLMVISHRAGQGKEANEILGEGSIVCWQDGRVLGVVNDTFGPLSAPMYTLILPDPFAPPIAPVEKEQAAPPAAQLEAKEKTATAEVSPGVVEPVVVQAEVESVEVPSPTEDTLVTEVSTSEQTVEAVPLSQAEALEVEALVAPASIPTPDESSTTLDPWPENDLPPASPPAPHRTLPPPFPKAELVGITVYYPVKSSNTVPVAQLKRQRWTDASNMYDEEVGDEEMEWSDDEAEAAAKRRRKMSRGSKADSVRGGSPTPSVNSQWGGSHFDAASDDEGTVLNYSGEATGEASLPRRPMPMSYDDLDSTHHRGEPERGERGGKRGGAKGGRGKGKERASDGPPSRGGFEGGRGRGGGRGGRGAFDGGSRGIGRPRGRGGAMGSPHNPHRSANNDAPVQARQQSSAPPPPPPPPARPMSPTSIAIARATGQMAPGGQPPYPGQQQFPHPPPPFYPQRPYGYPGQFGQHPPYPPPASGMQAPQQGAPQSSFRQPAFQPPAPFGGAPVYPPPYGSYGQAAFQQPSQVQAALQQQQAEHNKQLLEMQRQIALLSRKNASAAGRDAAGASGQ